MQSGTARLINALVTETLKRRELLESLVEQCGLWKKDSNDSRALRLLLAHELLFGRGLRQPGLRSCKDEALVEALEKMRFWEAATLKAAKASAHASGTTPAAMAAAEAAADGLADASEAVRALPRYARVNSLKATLDAVVATLCAEGWTLHDPPHGVGAAAALRGIPTSPPPPLCFWIDAHVPDLLCLPPHTELHQHALVISDVLILQDKASCLAPAALKPTAGERILDCCAAPGNKTTQLAALSAPGGLVIACERDARRAGVLRQRAERAAGKAVRVLEADFLEIDPRSEPYDKVTAVQLDPTCSGSGMVERANYQLDAEGGDAVNGGGQAERLLQLGTMQLGLLQHAMSFPAARVVVYSTCSVHPVEDELVVAAALADPAVKRQGWKLAPALPTWPCRGLPLVEGAEMLVRAGPEVQTNGFFVARFEREVAAKKKLGR